MSPPTRFWKTSDLVTLRPSSAWFQTFENNGEEIWRQRMPTTDRNTTIMKTNDLRQNKPLPPIVDRVVVETNDIYANRNDGWTVLIHGGYIHAVQDYFFAIKKLERSRLHALLTARNTAGNRCCAFFFNEDANSHFSNPASVVNSFNFFSWFSLIVQIMEVICQSHQCCIILKHSSKYDWLLDEIDPEGVQELFFAFSMALTKKTRSRDGRDERWIA